MKAKRNRQEGEHDAGEVPRTTCFERFAKLSARMTGHPVALTIAIAVILVWGVTGPIFHFSDTWQLVINTATTIVTFLMVFLIQNAQNRDNEAIQLKLDELIRATEGAHNAFLDVEEISEPELDRVKMNFGQLARKAREDLRKGRSDLGCPEVGRKPGHHGKAGRNSSQNAESAEAAPKHK